jgi:hypothetical protein
MGPPRRSRSGYMSAFREHFLDKYFGYRDQYVAYMAEHAPRRKRLAIASEVARLSFSLAGSVLCAAIFWVLAAEAIERAARLTALSATFLVCALGATFLCVLALHGLAAAARAFRQGSERP